MRAGTYKVFLLVAFAAALCSGLVHAQGRLLRGEPGGGIEFEERPSRYEARLDGDNLTTGSVAPGATDYALVFDAAGNPVKVLWSVVFSGIEDPTPPTPVPTATPQPTPTPLAFPGEEGQVLVSDGEGGVEAKPVMINSDGDVTAGSGAIFNAGKFETNGAEVDGANIRANGNITADGTVSGTTVTATNWVGLPVFGMAQATVGENVSAGQPLYRRSDGVLMLASAISSATMPAVAVAAETITSGTAGSVLRMGLATDAGWSFTAGDFVFVSADSPGLLSADRPTSSGCMVQIIGMAESATTVWLTLAPVMVELD